VQGLQIKLLRRFGCHKVHGGPLYRLGNGLSIAVIVFMALEERLRIFRRHQPPVVAKGDQLPA
jgi:hypothetical protein